MRKEKAKSDYKKLKDSELAILAGKVAGLMEGNTHFSTDIKPTAAELLAAAEDYRIKHEIAINGGSTLEKNLKKESRDKILELLSHLAYAVNMEAKGNIVALSSTGLMLNKTPAPQTRPGVSLRVLLRDGYVSGQLRADFDKIPDVYENEIQIGIMDSITEKIDWGVSQTTSTSSGNIIDNLTPGTRYYVRVRGKNRMGYGDWSDAVSIIAR